MISGASLFSLRERLAHIRAESAMSRSASAAAPCALIFGIS